MWNDTRRGRNLIRNRNTRRFDQRYGKNIITIFTIVFAILLVGMSGIYIYKWNVNEIANNSSLEDLPVNGEDVLDIYTEVADKEEQTNENNEQDKNTNSSTELPNDEEIKQGKEFTFVALGEIMMGQFAHDRSFSYSLTYTDISEVSKDADYTFASIATNIIDLDVIENATSKYIVTKDITKAFTALGVDGINVATDHIMDFTKKVFDETKNILIDSKLDVLGLQDDIIYASHDGIKVAFIAVCNEVIGSYSKYVSAGISMYDDYMVKIKQNIKKAKENADTVILVTHLGSENTHEVTDVMSWFYRELIKAGADMVLGNHALGVFPIEIYNGKPIIYSLGYLMSDTDYEVGKKSGIFKFVVDADGKIKKLEITPTYIVEEDVKLYMEYDRKAAINFMEYISKYSEKYGFKKEITEDKLIIEF